MEHWKNGSSQLTTRKLIFGVSEEERGEGAITFLI